MKNLGKIIELNDTTNTVLVRINFSTPNSTKTYLSYIYKYFNKPDKHIIAASRISINRVSVFFDSSQMVDTFLSPPTGIRILNQLIYGQYLKNKSKKVVLLNVSPGLTNDSINT